jgi:anaerobic magnesium-protoporphyrin IX monomethyl ester cyclase
MTQNQLQLITEIRPAMGSKPRSITAGKPANVRNKVVLFYPAYDGPPFGPPLCLLALAAPLLEAGFEVSLIDAAIVPRAPERVLAEAANALCVGVSVLTGPMITAALDAVIPIKQKHPEVAIIFGGWHPSLAADQTLADEAVDIVVRGQGEMTLLEIAQRLRDEQSLAGVQGASYKDGTRRIHNPDRTNTPYDALPTPAYHLIDHDAYERACGSRKLTYATSIGCPYACNYCTDQVFYGRRFNAYSAERVVAELTALVRENRIDEVSLLDSNFPVDVRRSNAIAKGIYESGVRFKWTFQASTDFLSRMTDDEVRMMGASGVTFMGFGTESASESVLKAMNKRHQRVPEMYETARKAELAGIRVSFNLIFGYPGETEADRVQTLRIMNGIAHKHTNVSFSPNIFTPYPGIPIWPQLRELKVHEPASLREWAELPLGANTLPWLMGAEQKRLNAMLRVFLVNNSIRQTLSISSKIGRILRSLLAAPLEFRLRTGRFAFPWEAWVAGLTNRVVTKRSLLTGQVLRTGQQKVC